MINDKIESQVQFQVPNQSYRRIFTQSHQLFGYDNDIYNKVYFPVHHGLERLIFNQEYDQLSLQVRNIK